MAFVGVLVLRAAPKDILRIGNLRFSDLPFHAKTICANSRRYFLGCIKSKYRTTWSISVALRSFENCGILDSG